MHAPQAAPQPQHTTRTVTEQKRIPKFEIQPRKAAVCHVVVRVHALSLCHSDCLCLFGRRVCGSGQLEESVFGDWSSVRHSPLRKMHRNAIRCFDHRCYCCGDVVVVAYGGVNDAIACTTPIISIITSWTARSAVTQPPFATNS